MKLGALALVPNGIEHVRDAVLECLIADIDSIASTLGEAGLISSQRISRLAAGGLHHASRTFGKRILAIGVGTRMVGKARLWGRLPLVAIGHLYIIALGTVVVNDDLFLLPVALTRCKDDGTRLLQHGNQVGNDDGLCVLVFSGTKQLRTLPAPVASALVVEASVTGP